MLNKNDLITISLWAIVGVTLALVGQKILGAIK